MSKIDKEKEIREAVQRFLSWLENYGYLSYDQFDFWGSKLGVFSKKLYLKNKWLSAPLVLILQGLESFLPRTRVFFAKKQRFAIGDAHFALGFMNLFQYFKKEEYLETAKQIVDIMLSYASTTPSGIGWGYPYTWVTGRAVYSPGTPFITVTPYCFEALLEIHSLLGEEKYLNKALQAAKFAAYDLNEIVLSVDEVASGYGPGDNSKVINANTYRAALLLKAYESFDQQEFKDRALKNINFVLKQQQSDGSWFYADNEFFIDNFHTCFVLKNLFKAYTILKDPGILESIKRGYEYYRRHLFREDGTPIHFSKQTAPKFRKIEMYDYAEGIALGPLLKKDIEGAYEFSLQLANHLISVFQLKPGYFVTRITTFNTKNRVPYLRWPQAQLFYALTRLLL